MSKPKFKVGQVVACYGIPEIKESKKFLGYHQIAAVEKREGAPYYNFDGQLIRESRLRPLTRRERGGV